MVHKGASRRRRQRLQISGTCISGDLGIWGLGDLEIWDFGNMGAWKSRNLGSKKNEKMQKICPVPGLGPCCYQPVVGIPSSRIGIWGKGPQARTGLEQLFRAIYAHQDLML